MMLYQLNYGAGWFTYATLLPDVAEKTRAVLIGWGRTEGDTFRMVDADKPEPKPKAVRVRKPRAKPAAVTATEKGNGNA